ncbi:MAG: precorrin-6A reductase [Clostridiales bacterium]
MTKILVIAGTADGVDFIKATPPNFEITATTFSKLGEECIAPRKNLTIITGALAKEGFIKLINENHLTHIVDMSHPFAVEVSKNAFEAAQALSLPYFRYERESMEKMENRIDYPDFPTAVENLEDIKGNLLLTIGSRNLHYFTKLSDFYQRCYVRVLASSKIMLELEEMQIDPGHIFAMKGVASKDLNIALAKEINAQAIITKDSGLKGGMAEKYQAAKELNIPLIVISKPQSLGKKYTNFTDIINEIGRD